MDFHNWLLFASIAFIATITPGPAVLLTTSHSAAYGWKHSIATILGNISGLFIMSALSVLGLSAIILSSTVVFEAVKFAGAAYLVFLGIKLWRNGFISEKHAQTQASVQSNKKRAFFQGLAVALSNPKAIAFTTALFPQFIVQEGSLALQFSVLVFTFMMLSFFCLVAYSITIERAKNKLFLSETNVFSKLFGATFIASGIVLANATKENS